MLQQDEPDDYVIGTGESHGVKEFVELAFAHLGLDWTKHVTIDSRYYRPAEVDSLCADPSKARRHLGWHHRTEFPHLVKIMVDAESQAIAAPSPGRGSQLEDWHAAGLPNLSQRDGLTVEPRPGDITPHVERLA
jgi:GDPmannose 4,6-dehydratase